VAPTVFDRVRPDMKIAQEEIFGPVVAVLEARDFDEAVALANDTRFGLSASVVTRDLGLAMRFIREIEAGIVHVNSQTAGAEPQVPFGGFKGSSSGSREQGKVARDFFTQIKTVYLDPLEADRSTRRELRDTPSTGRRHPDYDRARLNCAEVSWPRD
jgi:aldehyde dehydrogenase (NAD+)